MNVDNGFVAEMTETNLLEPEDREFTVVVRPPLAVILWLAPRPTIELSRRAFLRLLAHPDFQPHFGVVSDWRRATADAAPHFDRDFLAALDTLQTSGRLRGRWATVVPASAHMIDLYRAGRTIEMMGRPAGLRYDVFVNYDEAVEWAANREPAPLGQWLSLDTTLRSVTSGTATSISDLGTTGSHLRSLRRKR